MDNGCSCCSTWSIIAVMLIAVCTRGALASVDTTPAPEPAPEADGPPEFLFQMVATGAIFEAGEGSFDGVLTLENVNNETIAFSDRPERIARTVPTDEFVLAAFAPDDGPADDSFFDDPPNAARILEMTALQATLLLDDMNDIIVHKATNRSSIKTHPGV